MKLILLCAVLIPTAFAATINIGKLEQVFELRPGDQARFLPNNLVVTLESIKKHESECAIPDQNCGSGYMPGVHITPIFKVTQDKSCLGTIIPKNCEVIQHVVEKINDQSVKVKFISPFTLCEKEMNLDNKNSCFIQIIKNGHDKPPYSPENCERITDNQASKDRCYETIADKLQDEKICGSMKGNIGFQCLLLIAKKKKDPEFCKTLKKGPFHHTESALQDEINACMGYVRNSLKK